MKIHLSALSRLVLAGVICAAFSGCSHEDILIPKPGTRPCGPPYPGYPFQLGKEDIEISPDGETVTIEPFGSNGNEFVTLSYMAETPFILEDAYAIKYIQQGHVGSMSVADFYNAFSIAEYNNALGLPDCVNSPEVEYEYKWLKVKCYKRDSDSHSQLMISIDENTTGQPREMFLYFTKPWLGVVDVIQYEKNASYVTAD